MQWSVEVLILTYSLEVRADNPSLLLSLIAVSVWILIVQEHITTLHHRLVFAINIFELLQCLWYPLCFNSSLGPILQLKISKKPINSVVYMILMFCVPPLFLQITITVSAHKSMSTVDYIEFSPFLS